MLALGIDPGSAICGYGFVELINGQLIAKEFGVITTSPQARMQDRLLKIHTELDALIKNFQPQVMGIEKLFFGKNSTTAITVAQARGVVLLCAAQNNLDIIEITPNEVKQSVTGYGGATKEQVIYMVTKILNLPTSPTPDDAADALAISIAAGYEANSLARRNLLET
ncbi:MAG: crossover junction endodeoxyribonuclease RuvC [Selenomonadaceae bacterium]|nr:crossover junction endodeoxyribonuclease RuvC [Selenomonadaceae bacterium]MBQ7494069.1 crossover junction endodeoxyribonuclease RuvC [Selenomonadaceae bacterium]